MSLLANMVPPLAWCVTYAFCAWVAWDFGKRWVSAWDRSRIANERMTALEATLTAEMQRLVNGALGGIVDDLRTADERLAKLEPKDEVTPRFRTLHQRMPRPKG